MAKKFTLCGQEVLYYPERRSLPDKMRDLNGYVPKLKPKELDIVPSPFILYKDLDLELFFSLDDDDTNSNEITQKSSLNSLNEPPKLILRDHFTLSEDSRKSSNVDIKRVRSSILHSLSRRKYSIW